MRNIFLKYFSLLLISLLFLVSCKSDLVYYDLRGKKRPVWFEPVPYGMVYIKQGSYQMGGGDQVLDQRIQNARNVSVNSFWMDETEITNSEYRQYVKWVADSVAVSLTFKAGIDYYKAVDKDKQLIDPPMIDRAKAATIWTDDKTEVTEALKPLFYQGKERFEGKRELDYRQIFYEYYVIDLKQAALLSNSFDYETQKYSGSVVDHKTGKTNPIKDRSSFIIKNRVPVYPDTLVWVRDFTYSYNEPWTLKYFYHPAFNEYPVVGVTWEQANAFCHWRTMFRDQFLAASHIQSIHPYRLPTEAEWEYAARGGKVNNKYPWGSYYTSTHKGCYLANFKPLRGNYIADSYYSAKTMKVGSFDPNGYGLYDMAGNVSEWTSTAYDPSGHQMVSTFNPEFQYDASDDDPPALKRKVVRGGSWKDVSYYLQVSTRDYEYQDSARCFVGFRCIMNALEDERE
ncbi:MAG TPA: SUMF1/EgtB/PvdO family nonheme iron enzyme [Prolixibacteraceae bacterium]|nr:SUMF1/EgtB/PvdO family nonheme iron enzyme [Prolixibacteraceae bacterium]